MYTEWKIIFGYRFGPKANAQAIYDALFQAALSYKFKNLQEIAVPVNSVTLTDAIFKLNVHDQIKLPFGKSVDGQSLKELFITTIFLKYLETLRTKFPPDPFFFIVLPPKPTSCDTAVIVSESAEVKDVKQLRLPKNHIPFLFQVKEYLNPAALQDKNLSIPKPVDIKKIEDNVSGYSESVLVFMRDFSDYQSEQFKDFFDRNPNCYLIAVPTDIQFIPKGSSTQTIESISLDPNKHNYIISFPDGETLSLVNFEWPKCLVELKTKI